NISATGNAITAGQTNVEVIRSIAPGISSVTMSPPGGILINGFSGGTTNNPCTVRITEGFLNAFGVTVTTDLTQTISTMVRVLLSVAPPPGVTLDFPGTASTVGTSGSGGVASAFSTAECYTGAVSGAGVSFTSSSTGRSVCYRVTTNTDLTLERLEIPVTATVSASATLPLPA